MDNNPSSFIRTADLLEAIPEPIIIIDDNGLIVSVNQQIEKLFGHNRAELLGKFADYLLPDRFQSKKTAYHKDYFSNPRPTSAGMNVGLLGLKVDGTEFPIEINLSPLETEQGRFIVAAVRDITLRKKVEAQFKSIVEAAPDCLIIVNKEGSIVLVNGLVEKLFGHLRKKLLGKKLEMLMPERYRARHEGHRQNYFMQPRSRVMGANLELFGLHQNGQEFPVEISLSPLETEEGLLILAAVRDISERKKMEEAKAMLAAIVQSADDAIIGKDLNGIIFIWNQGAEKLYGYSATEVIGKNIQFIFPPERQNEFNDIIHQITQGESISQHETLRVCKDGTLVPVSATISPIKNSHGKVIGASTTARDITQQKQLTEQLRIKNLEIANASLAKDHFLASMSHELRTPLNAIIGFTGTLLMKLPGPLTADQAKQLKTVDSSAKYLLSIINDMLDLAKIESGKVEFQLEKINCNEVIAEIAATLSPLAETKKINLIVSAPKTKISAITDRRTLTQILLNLSNNALKFTEKGSIEIKINTKKIAQKEFVVIDVIDTGIGIKQEHQDRLFKAFERIEISGRPTVGTGLGLYVSQKLAILINAKIDFETEFGKGSRFSVLIPKEQPT